MSAVSEPRVLFLFEDEIREAGRHLEKLRQMQEADDTPDDAWSAAVMEALRVCAVALAGAHEDDACILLTRKSALACAPEVQR